MSENTNFDTIIMKPGECWHYQNSYHFGPGKIDQYSVNSRVSVENDLPPQSVPKLHPHIKIENLIPGFGPIREDSSEIRKQKILAELQELKEKNGW